MITALEADEGSASRPGLSLPPGKTRYPLYRRLGGLQGRSGQVQKISPPPGFDPRTVQPLMYVNTASVFIFAIFPILCHILMEILVYAVERISYKSSSLVVSFFSAFFASQLFRQRTGVFTDILEGLTLTH